MEKFKEKITHKRTIASFVSFLILMLLFFAGPAQAFVLDLTVDDSTPTKGDEIKFTATLDIENIDKYLPIKNFTLSLTGPTNASCNFDVHGNILSGCSGMSINPLSIPDSSNYGYGYGYGYGYSYGYSYGYNFGYDYGYGYNQGIGAMTFEYEITLDTDFYLTGTYETSLNALIGTQTFSKAGEDITISDEETSGDNSGGNSDGDDDQGANAETSTFSGDSGENSDNSDEDEENPIDENGDSEDGGNPNFFSAITGAVIGALGTPGSILAFVFIVAVVGILIFVIRKRKASQKI